VACSLALTRPSGPERCGRAQTPPTCCLVETQVPQPPRVSCRRNLEMDFERVKSELLCDKDCHQATVARLERDLAKVIVEQRGAARLAHRGGGGGNKHLVVMVGVDHSLTTKRWR
jgi:hypothetical protein